MQIFKKIVPYIPTKMKSCNFGMFGTKPLPEPIITDTCIVFLLLEAPYLIETHP